MPRRIVALVGSTAVGKTGLALRLARTLDAEIVSADSMQIYRGMDIGTAKPTPEQQALAPHHLIDIVDPDEAFHAGRYREAADRAVEGIRGRGKLPLVVGGTGLYIKALLHGLFHDPPAEPRASWAERLASYGRFAGDPHEALARVDPATARTIHPHDRVRARRALDVFVRTGKSITALRDLHGFQENRYDALVVGLRMDRTSLVRRIDARVDAMVRAGLLDEVRGLLDDGYSADLPSMKGLGYRHMVRFLEGAWSMETATENLKRDTRRYAKRQRTWFEHQETVVWFHGPDPAETICETIQRFLQGPVKKIV